jgi:hypothetical protein
MDIEEISQEEESRLHTEVSRGDRAKALLENPLLVEAFKAVEEDLMNRWRVGPSRDAEAREKIWISTCLLDALKREIEDHITTGTLAKAQLENKGLLQRAKDYFLNQ